MIPLVVAPHTFLNRISPSIKPSIQATHKPFKKKIKNQKFDEQSLSLLGFHESGGGGRGGGGGGGDSGGDAGVFLVFLE
jgi:hypothetical protein